MLKLLLGAEDSFKGALAYNLLTFSALSLFAAFLYVIYVGAPLAIGTFANKK